MARLCTFSVFFHRNSWSALQSGLSLLPHPLLIACSTGASSSISMMNKSALGMSKTCRGRDECYRFSTGRAFSSMDVSGINGSIHGEHCLFEDFTTSSGGHSKAKNCVVVVESPTKAKTIQKYLGPDYIVLPTFGHVRELAVTVGAVRPHEDYAMLWEVRKAAHTYIGRIKQALKSAEQLILASDPDREGEAIAWHVTELLKDEGFFKGSSLKVVRVTFNEITEGAVLEAMKSPRDICLTLVTAYLARRALDRLFGFSLSSVLWRKLPGSKSAGRVQSVALKLVCEREEEIEKFVAQEYWTIEAYARLEHEATEESLFLVRPTHIDGGKIEKFAFAAADAALLSQRLSNQLLKVSSVQRSSKRRNPPQPYITSTLQMDAQKKLGYGALQTMALAQKLYEGIKLENEEPTGLITYMRTDGLQLSSDSIKDVRALIAQRYGDQYVPSEFRKFKSKVKNAQEAHEAIRPTNIYLLPSNLVDLLEKQALHLYTLIWKRTVACQMEQAVYEEAVVNFVTEDASVCLQGGCSIVSFPGFLAAMEDKHGIKIATDDGLEGESDHDHMEVGKSTSFFSLKKDDRLVVQKAEARQHFTRPPSRFTEGLLVKAMEDHGIGRPSTYATVLKTLQSRNYVETANQRISPTARGRMVTAFLSHYFTKYVDYKFTALLEDQLDDVSGGHMKWKEVLRGFWPEFEGVVAASMKIDMSKVVEMLQDTLFSQCLQGLGISGHTCPSCGQGKITLKLSSYGSGYFFGCNRYPDCSFCAELLGDDDAGVQKDNNVPSKIIQVAGFPLGLDPDTNLEVRVKKGPYGYYIQSGEKGNTQNFKIPKGIDPTNLTLEKAKELMKFPLTLGKHPEDGKLITLGIGNTSHYVRHQNVLAPVPKGSVPEEITLEHAVQLLKGENIRLIRQKKKELVERKAKIRNLPHKAGVMSRTRKAATSTAIKGEDDLEPDLEPKKNTKKKSTEKVEGEVEAKKIRKSNTVKADGSSSDPKIMKKLKESSKRALEIEPKIKNIRKQRVLDIEGEKVGPKAKAKNLSSVKVEDKDNSRKMTEPSTSDTQTYPTRKVDSRTSPDRLQQQNAPGAKILPPPHECNESAASNKQGSHSGKKSISVVSFKDAAEKNESTGTTKWKSRGEKTQLAVETVGDDLLSKTIENHPTEIEEAKTTQRTAGYIGKDTVRAGKSRAMALTCQDKKESDVPHMKTSVTGQVPSKANENGKLRAGRKKASLVAVESVQGELKAKEGSEPRDAVEANGKVR